MKSVIRFLFNWLQNYKFSEHLANFLAVTITLIILAGIAIIGFYIVREIIIRVFLRITTKTKNDWDDILFKHKVFHRFAHLVPAAIVFYSHFLFIKGGHLAQPGDLFEYPWLSECLLRAGRIYFLSVIVSIIISFLNGLEEIYFKKNANQKSIKSYIQVVKILVYLFSGVLLVSILINEDPTKMLAGLTAATAILLLVFKDTILSFVAGIKLSTDKMVQLGDWIEMPAHQADGIVTEINLNTVKVQNWDKTITTIPTYTMTVESFINWKGMEESGARRVKRSIRIDMNSIRLCSNELLDKFSRNPLLHEYIAGLKNDTYRPANIGLFRHYMEAYIRQHPQTHADMLTLVRNQQPTETGLPIEITTYSNKTDSVSYERYQSELVDHILSVLPAFGLRAYQSPSGYDLKKE